MAGSIRINTLLIIYCTRDCTSIKSKIYKRLIMGLILNTTWLTTSKQGAGPFFARINKKRNIMKVCLIDWIMTNYVIRPSLKEELIKSINDRIHERGYTNINDAYKAFSNRRNTSVGSLIDFFFHWNNANYLLENTSWDMVHIDWRKYCECHNLKFKDITILKIPIEKLKITFEGE